MLVEGKVGPATLGDGSLAQPRLDRTGAMATVDAHARYAEAVRRGNCFFATSLAATSIGTALTASAVTITVYNPATSSVYVSLLEASAAITTFPAAAASGSIVLAVNNNPLAVAPVTNTAAITFGNALIGGNPTTGQARAFTTTTLPAAPVTARCIGSFHIIGATPVTETGAVFIDVTDGKIMLAPNAAVTIQGILSASSWAGTMSMLWEELPI